MITTVIFLTCGKNKYNNLPGNTISITDAIKISQQSLTEIGDNSPLIINGRAISKPLQWGGENGADQEFKIVDTIYGKINKEKILCWYFYDKQNHLIVKNTTLLLILRPDVNDRYFIIKALYSNMENIDKIKRNL